MAGLEEMIETATDAGNCTTTPQVCSPSRARSKESGDGTESSRRWTRSQSPLRQLLSASNSRPSSPKNNRTQGGRGDGDDSAPSMVVGFAAELSPTLSSDSVRSAFQRQQQHQQQRVCLKSVLHPVSYDECHIPSEDEQGGGGGGDDGCDNGSTTDAAPGATVSADGVVSDS